VIVLSQPHPYAEPLAEAFDSNGQLQNGSVEEDCGTTLHAYGYGRKDALGEITSGTLQRMTTRWEQCTQLSGLMLPFKDKLVWTLNPKSTLCFVSVGFVESLSILHFLLSKGDSGGPLIDSRRGRLIGLLGGIVKGSKRMCEIGKANYFTRLSSCIKFIRDSLSR